MLMEKTVYFSEALPAILVSVTLAVLICLMCLCFELYSRSKYKKGEIDDVARKRQCNLIISIFFSLISLWVIGFVLFINVVEAYKDWPLLIICAIMLVGTVIYTRDLWKKL